jgi:hypothetical protein
VMSWLSRPSLSQLSRSVVISGRRSVIVGR